MRITTLRLTRQTKTACPPQPEADKSGGAVGLSLPTAGRALVRLCL